MSKYIVEDIGKVVQLMRDPERDFPYYIYGHRVEISRRLTDMDKDKNLKYAKFPLVALRLDILETYKNGLVHYSLNIGIIHKSKKEYTALQRYDLVFKPVLYPLYEKFWVAFKRAGLFTWDGDANYAPHVKVDRPYWGVSNAEGNIKQLTDDPLDAIEMLDLKFSKTIKNCK
jgi:hypothetical protein